MQLLKKLLLLLLFALPAQQVCSQIVATSWLGRMSMDQLPDEYVVKVSGSVVDSLTNQPLPGAIISIARIPDIRYNRNVVVRNIATDKNGEFEFKEYKSEYSRVSIEGSFLGYKMKSESVDMEAEKQTIVLQLAPSATDIDDIVVRTRIEMYKTKGDTLVFFPAAVKTMDGDAAIEILRSMPGVEVGDDGNIKIGDKQVERTYVNNELIFGQDPRLAFKYLIPGQIASIEAYDELVEESVIAVGEANARKRKVLNVKTFEDIGVVVTAAVSVAGGADFKADIDKETQLRYGVSAEGNLFKTGDQLRVSGATGNTSLQSSGMGDFYYAIGGRGLSVGNAGYSRSNAANVAYSHGDFSTKHSYSVDYAFSDNRNRMQSRSIAEYTSDNRITYDTVKNNASSWGHALDGRYQFYEKNTFVEVSGGIQHGRNKSNGLNLYREMREGALSENTSTRSRSKRDNINASANLSTQNKIGRVSLGTRAHYVYADGDTGETVTHYDYQQGLETVTVKDGSTPSTNLNAGVTGGIRFGKKIHLNAEYGFAYDRNRSELIARDMETLEIREDISRQQTTNNSTHTAKLSFMYGDDKHTLSANVGHDFIRMHIDDKYADPGFELMERDFRAWSPSLSYMFRLGDMSDISLSYNYNQQPPSLEMFSDRVVATDNEERYFSAGNPRLKLSGTHGANISYTNFKMEKHFQASAYVSVYDNAIVRNERYFAEDTVLPEYDGHLFKAGQTLTTYINSPDKSLRVGGSASMGFTVKPLKTSFNVGVNYGYSNPQQGIKDEIVRNETHTGSVNVSMNTNFSRAFRMRISNRTSYSHSMTQSGKNRTWNESVSANVDVSFLKHAAFAATYRFRHAANSLSTIEDTDEHILNASISYRIFKNRKGTITFQANDILSNRKNYNTSTDANRIVSTWSQIYSSYFMCMFEYRFNGSR